MFYYVLNNNNQARQRIHLAYLARSHNRIQGPFFASKDPTINSNNNRATSTHAEIQCLKNTRNAKFDKWQLVSISFDISRNSIHLSHGKPCTHCAIDMSKHGVRWITYSTPNKLIKISIDKLLPITRLSSGWQWKVDSTISNISRLYIRKEETFHQINNKEKTIEVRLFRGFVKTLNVNDTIMIMYDVQRTYVKVIRIRRFSSFKNMLEKECLNNIMPSCKNKQEAMARFRTYYKKYDETKFTVVAIEISIIS